MSGPERVVIGNAELWNINCLDLMRLMPDAAFDLAIVDPPYFDGPNKSGYYGKGFSSLGVQRAKHYDSLPAWEIPGTEYFEQLTRVSRHQIIWGANHFADRFNAASPSWIVWDKDNGASSFADVELAYCSMDCAARMFRYMWNGMHQGQRGGNKKLNESRIHPTQKPVALYEWLIDRYAEPGMRVLDTHLGSGSSAIAANRSAVQFVGTEIDPAMFSAACDRIRRHQAQGQMFAPEVAAPVQEAFDMGAAA